MKKTLFLLLAAMMVMMSNGVLAQYYDFTDTLADGQVLYFDTLNGMARVVRPGLGSEYNNYVSGNLNIPSTVTYNGVTYTVTTLAIKNSNWWSNGGTFANCDSLTSVTIPSTIECIQGWPFFGCNSLTTINYNAENLIYYADSNMFLGCRDNITTVNIGNTVKTIPNYLFFRFSELTSIEIPNSVKRIGGCAFSCCNELTSIRIPDSVTYIGWSAFAGCTNLDTVIIGESVDTICHGAFWNCNDTIRPNVYSESWYLTPKCCLSNVTILSEYPPVLDQWGSINPFSSNGANIAFHIPCGSYAAYHSAWNWANNLLEPEVNYTLNVLSNDSTIGAVSIVQQNGRDVYCDSSAIILATPIYGYHLDHWSNESTANRDTLYLEGDSTVTAFFAINQYSVIGSSNDTNRGVVYGGDTVNYLDTVTFIATPNYGYHLNYWRYTRDNGTMHNLYGTDTLQLVATRNKTATAYFSYNQYSITLSVDTTIHGAVSGAGNYNYLSERTISATANHGYHFTMWSDGDTNNPRTLTLTQDTAFTALFAKNQYLVTLSVNDTALGMVTGDGTFNYLDTVTLTATCTAEHHHFVRWSDGITADSRTIVLVNDTAFTALFAIDTHSVTLAVNDDLFGSVSGMGNYPYGAEVAIEATANEGYHFAEWSNGSRENPTIITIESDTVLTASFTDDVVPQICMVTVQDGRNTLMWEKGLEVQQYNVYREGMTAGEYELAASVPYDSLSVWIDTASRPRTRSYRYRLTATDVFGIESEPSEIHKTMHLTINQGMGNEWNLVWTEYEGAEYSTYVIYRGTDASNIQQIDVIPAGGNTTYTDENAPTGEVYYQVGILLNTPCNPTKSSTIVRSNIATNVTVGIAEATIMDDDIRVYGENGCIHVSRDGQTVDEFHVYDVMGREVYHARHENHTSILPEGVYLVKVGIYPARRVVVIR